ncbi:Portal protein [Devosia sp. DBB001]|nr:Portal protein [Devosia sp. DBB001]
MAEKDDLVAEGREMFTLCQDAENENRETGKEDLRFARNGEQWPEQIRRQREKEGRPCLTINVLPSFGRQVTNDARMNKPAIKVRAVDDRADPETAEVLGDLIRHIEYSSNASAAYDTGIECAVFNGFGYWRIGLDYAYDDVFDMDLSIKRIRNPFSVYGDPYSTAVDSSDWNDAFVVDRISRDAFARKYKGKAVVDFSDTDAWGGEAWIDGDTVQLAEWWHREEAERQIVQLLDHRSNELVVVSKEDVESNEELMALLGAGIVEFRRERTALTYKVRQRTMSGMDILKDEAWPGRYIPIVPVYGDEFDIEGKVYRRALTHDAKSSQQMMNYWRSTSTELVALAPRTPYIGPTGFADSDKRWDTVNSESHPFLEYDGAVPPQRQTLDAGPSIGAMQEGLAANDDMKRIMGLYDASLGARSNETSGVAIRARKVEGDMSTFDFSDNQVRAIRHTGCILIDLIPHVYSNERVLRIRGENGKERSVKVNAPYQKQNDDGEPMADADGAPLMALHDLTVGKYDVAVSAGPSFTTRREEAGAEMMQLLQSFPQAAPLIGDILAGALDWPGADEIAKRLRNMVPKQALGEDGGIPAEIQQKLDEGVKIIQKLAAEVEQLKADKSVDMAKVQVDASKVKVDAFKAETERMQAMSPAPVVIGMPPSA